MNHTSYALAFAGGLLIGMLVCLEIGRRIGTRRLAQDPEGAKSGVGVVEGAVFGLLGLLLAFTFSGAATRFDTRRQLIVEEANNIGTAWLRLDLLPTDAATPLREWFRQYLDARIATYRKLADPAAAQSELARSIQLQNKIWSGAVTACQDTKSQPAHMLLLPALNQMIDISCTRTAATRLHPHPVIYAMLAALSLVASLLAGSGMAGGASRNWIHPISFAAAMATTVFVIADIEYPRLGLIRIDRADQVLIDLRQSMQ